MKITRLLLCVALAAAMVGFLPAHTKKAQAAQTLIVTTSPGVLTAGVVSELADPTRPFQIMVTDQSGKPVDLTRSFDGQPIETKVVWNQLFTDPHPDNQNVFGRDAVLPQYYWTRTDLHNDDGSNVCNWKLFGKNLIEIDFSQSSRGIYTFKGFVANDEGEFYIRVTTPDRKTAGTVKVQVRSPIVSYQIKNTEDKDARIFDSPGDPDFIMTACDNRIYNVRVTVMDAEGKIIKGITEGVTLCTGIKKTARFTPFTTRPANYEWAEKPTFVVAPNFYSGSTAYFLENQGKRYNLHIGLDLNNNGQLEWTNKELFGFGPQNVFDTQNRQWTDFLTYYNTVNVMYNNGEYSEHPFFDLPPTDYGGWGLGSIYNSAKFDGLIFANYDENNAIDYRDSLNLDVKGQTSFYLFAEDVCYVGGLVGDSFWADLDVAGRPPSNNQSPRYVTSRWRGDGVYFLDFDAVPDNLARLAPPNFTLLDAETREELPKYFFKTNNYDLIYALQNHVVVVALPADSRDLPIHIDNQVGFVGNQHENSIYGKFSFEDRYDDVETTMHYTPTGTGAEVVEMRFKSRNAWWMNGLYGSPIEYELQKVMYLDVYKGLEIIVEWDGQPEVGASATALITCMATGTQEVVPGCIVTVKGCGFEGSATTNNKGKISLPMTFKEEGQVTFLAEKQGFKSGVTSVRIGRDKIPPRLSINELPQLTREERLTVSGTTEPGCKVSVNAVDAAVDANGKFQASVKLEQGENRIKVSSTDPSGNTAEMMVVIEMDSIPPMIIVDNIDKLVDVQEVTISGRIEPGSRVRVGDVEAQVINDVFKAKVPLAPGLNNLVIIAMDKAGNSTEKPFSLIVWHKIVIKMLIGNTSFLVDDKVSDPPLLVSPYIASSRTMVPIRAISQAFGARVEWLPEDKSITITLKDGVGTTFIIMRVGSKMAYVNQTPVELDVVPEIKSGTTFVPLRFVAESLGCTVNYDATSKTVTIERLSY